MTLNTRVAIGAPTNVHEVFAYCRTLLGASDSIPIEKGWDYAKVNRTLRHPIGVGLDALLWLTYGADGPIIGRHDEDEDGLPQGWAAVEVSFDTAYGYRGENGEGCGKLHARLVRQLGEWLDRKDLPWKWHDEFYGDWHDSYDMLDQLGKARAEG
jgi:hypothetical protein